MKGIPAIKSVMTPFPYMIEIDQSLAQARAVMQQHRIRHLPVVEAGKLVSVLTERDIFRSRDPSLGLPPHEQLRVRDLCVIESYVVQLTEPLDRVLLHMARTHVDSALVVKEGKLVGIFTMTDACQRFGDLLRTLFPAGGSDDAA